MKTRPLRQILDAVAAYVGLPTWEGFPGGVWLEGLILAESGGRLDARRYEPHQDRAGRADAASDGDRPGIDDGLLEDDASYGLMQVMGYNVRRIVEARPGSVLGFTWTMRPLANLALGLRVLLGELAATNGDVPRALARFNGGPSGEDMVDGPTGREMRRQVYVRSVLLETERAAADRRVS